MRKLKDVINNFDIKTIIEDDDKLIIKESTSSWKIELSKKKEFTLRGKLLGGSWSPILMRAKYTTNELNDLISDWTANGVIQNFRTKLQEQKEKMSIRNWWLDASENNIEIVEVEVKKIIDGDTLHVEFDTGETEIIRLRYIDTPEIGHYDANRIYRKYDEKYCPYGVAATNELKQFCSWRGNKIKINIRIDEEELYTDRYGRVLAYLKGYSEDVVEKGLALPMFNYFIPPTLKSLLITKMEVAKQGKLGLFDKDGNAERRKLLKIESEKGQVV